MNTLDVPCPQCGSVEVVIGGEATPQTDQDMGGEPKAHIPRLHRCLCKNCRHAFQHDFAFSR